MLEKEEQFSGAIRSCAPTTSQCFGAPRDIVKTSSSVLDLEKKLSLRVVESLNVKAVEARKVHEEVIKSGCT